MVEHLKTKSRIPFSQRLFWSFLAIFLGFSACFLLFQYQREQEFAREKLNNILNNYNYQLFRRIAKEGNYNKAVQDFIDEIPQKELRLTIIDLSGNVLFDNSGKEMFANHNDRAEIKKARFENEGYAIRSSGSTGKRYFYSATRIENTIYRSALPWNPHTQQILAVNKDFIYFMAVITLLFLFVLFRFTLSIGQTISKLWNFASNVENGRIPQNEYMFPNDELGDISQNIIKLYHLQQKAKDDLSMEREKLIKHFQYAKEGFAMFTAEGKEILSNILFIQSANIISDKQIRQSEEILEIPELKTIRTFLQTHISNSEPQRDVLRESVTVDKGGKTFLFECILFLDNSYEISINDISRLEEENRMKRQLTQNVAHELKTPVSSIQGYLETIIHTPGIDEEKKQFFLERCYSQSSRLSGLLRDISVLNRLDEATDMFEISEVHIARLITEIEKECSKEIEERKITTQIILPEEPVIWGNHSLLYSIFRNLYDNAIAYAGEGITLTVHCYKEDSQYYYFSFADNGIGVAEEHINRIFERFYRVDKGRSRKAGGTGLGLSIVKNGVNFHKGQIVAKSKPGHGITFFFTLNKRVQAIS